MAGEYKKIELSLFECLVNTENILKKMEADEENLSVIGRDKELISTKMYNLAVMGAFKTGKSSLINALMGLRILPADVEPATATINRITYGPQLKAVVNFEDGTKRDVDISDLAGYVTKLTPDGASRADQIEEAVVYSPVVICQNHVDIIDTPGLNDEEKLTRKTNSILKNVDAVIVTISARSPFEQTDRDFVCQLIKSENINNIVFVVTFIDTLRGKNDCDRLIADIKNRIFTSVIEKLAKNNEPQNIIDKANTLLNVNDLRIYGISSELALDSFVSNDENSLRESRFVTFKNDLMQIITAKQTENTVQKTVRDINTVLSGLAGHYETQKNFFAGKRSEAVGHSQCICDYCDETGKKLSALFAANYKDMDDTINSLNSQKNFMAQMFIKELAKIKQNEHSVIEKAISTSSQVLYNVINENVLPAVKYKLLANYKKIVSDFGNERYESLNAHLEGLGITENVNLIKAISEIDIFIDREIHPISFEWSKSAVPGVSDLSKCDVMDHIIKVIDTSVSKLINDLNNFADSSRMFLFDRIKKDSQNIKDISKQAEGVTTDFFNKKSGNLEHNYAELSGTAKETIKSAEGILQEFYDAKM